MVIFLKSKGISITILKFFYVCMYWLNFYRCLWFSTYLYNSLPYILNQDNINAICHHWEVFHTGFWVTFISGLSYLCVCLFVSDDTKDIDSLSDEVTHNSNQNNSNCSSPSRMSDSVSLNTDSSQDTSLCSPVKHTHIGINSKRRFVNNKIIYLYKK